MKSLVAAPTCRRKGYSLRQWEAATGAYDRLLVTEDGLWAQEVREMGIPCELFAPVSHPRRQGRHAICGPLFNAAWEAILAGSEGFTHILALDTDVIPAGDILALMESRKGEEDFLRHGVPWRSDYQRPGCLAHETSCTFGSVEAWRRALDLTYTRGPLATLYGTVGDPALFTHVDIDEMPLEHLDA